MLDFTHLKPVEFPYKGRFIDNWFSNFTPCEFVYEGIRYQSVENFFVAMKTLDVNHRAELAVLSPSKAKAAGRKLQLRPDWERVKVSMMILGLSMKFSTEPHRGQLITANPNDLIEWNNWGDRYWGVDISDCKGWNMLGECLKIVRRQMLIGYFNTQMMLHLNT